jgi:hypothetical protein
MIKIAAISAIINATPQCSSQGNQPTKLTSVTTIMPSHYRRRSLIQPENIVPYFFSCAEAQKLKGSSEQVSKWNLVGKQNTEVFSVFFVILFVELSEITDVVSENSPVVG